MNKYIFTFAPGQEPTQAVVEPIINRMVPGQLFALYSHFYQPRGMRDCGQPLTVSWLRDPQSIPAILLLIDWQASSPALAARMTYLTQQLACGMETPAHVLKNHVTAVGYTEEAHAAVVAASEVLAAFALNAAPITHVYTTPSGKCYGTVIGLELTAEARHWITCSLADPT